MDTMESDIEQFKYHMLEAEKAFYRMKKKYQQISHRANDRWISNKSEASQYLGVSRTTYYKKYDHLINWTEKGVRKSTLDKINPEV